MAVLFLWLDSGVVDTHQSFSSFLIIGLALLGFFAFVKGINYLYDYFYDHYTVYPE